MSATVHHSKNFTALPVADTVLHLVGNRTVWWPEQKTLLFADSHFGKAATFRQAGMPVPEGTTARMLRTLSASLASCEVEHLVILGDFIHSSTRGDDDFEAELKSWRDQHTELRVTLVMGNHDRHCLPVIERLDFTVEREEVELGPFLLCHDPTSARYSDRNGFRLGGHLHPGFRAAGHREKALPCFWQTSSMLVLPAFGPFTGLAQVKPAEGDKIFVIFDEQIARLI